MNLNPPPFVELALCAQVDPELFFPEQGESSAKARMICNRCDVQAECLSWAIEQNIRYGVWGGLPPRGRDEVKWRRRRAVRGSGELAS